MNDSRAARALRLPTLLVLLLASLASAAGAEAKAPAAERVVPIWAGIKHGKPVQKGVVVVRTQAGKRLAPRARVGRTGAASVLAPRRLPRRFVVEVRRSGRPLLRADVRGWKGPRVVYVNPVSTLVHEYGKRHRKMSGEIARTRVQRHLGIGPETIHPESATFWSQRAFSAPRFARAARKHRGIVPFARKLAGEVDRAKRPHRFPAKPTGKKRSGKRGSGKPGRVGRHAAAAASAATASSSKSALEKLAERERLQSELMNAAKTALAVITGSPSAIYQLGQLLDQLLGGGDTKVLKQISGQLESIQIGIQDLEQELSAVDAEVSLAAYTTAVDSYRSTQQEIAAAWELYVHAFVSAGASETAGERAAAEAEAKALVAELKGWSNTIASNAAVPYDEGAPGLMAWAQNAFAKGQSGGTMTAANQQLTQAAGFKWWSYWWKDYFLHAQKWASPQTAGEVSERVVKTRSTETLAALEAAEAREYGETLPETLVYAIGSGKLYSVGTVWNVAPSVAPPANGQAPWSFMTVAEANALPANATGLQAAMVASVPEDWEKNPNSSMSGVLGPQLNSSVGGSDGGYGEPPEGTGTFALAPSAGAECYGQWQWYANGQGSSNTTGAPIIHFCPAYRPSLPRVEANVCSQVALLGVFYAWSSAFPSKEWSPGWWRNYKTPTFRNCNDFDKWQNAGSEYAGLNWGTGVFAGSAPLSNALDVSNSPSAYYALWTRPIGPEDKFLVGPVTNSG